MGQPTELIKLSLGRVLELGQEAFTSHEKYRHGKVTDEIELTKISVHCQTALENQCKWVKAVMEVLKGKDITNHSTGH